MGLVDKKAVVAAAVFEEAAQIGFGVENVVVIADDGVDPQRQIQGKFEGAYLVFARHVLNGPAGEGLVAKGFFEGAVDPVVVALGKGAFLGVAGLTGFGAKADFVAGGQGEVFEFQPGLAQVVEGFLGDLAAAGFGGQVKDFAAVALADGLDRRKQGGDGFADAGGGLGEKAAFGGDGAVDGGGQVALAFAVVVKGKF